jgi:beta-lactamase regulating signal transducer with metallopeptidase domain
MTSGILRPVIALPADWREWPDEAMDAVLAHELTHVARRDALTQLLSHANRALTSINPLSWRLHRHLADLAEQASDEAILDAGVSQTA